MFEDWEASSLTKNDICLLLKRATMVRLKGVTVQVDTTRRATQSPSLLTLQEE